MHHIVYDERMRRRLAPEDRATERVSVAITPAERDRLDRAVKTTGITLSHLVRTAITRELDRLEAQHGTQ